MPKKITIPGTEFWDEEKEQFIYGKDTTLMLEHSLVSISKWEAKYHKPFLEQFSPSNPKISTSEILDYIRFMTLTQNVDPDVYDRINNRVLSEITDYIKDPMTATWFSKKPKGKESRVITSEVIYCQMIALGIPFECQKWHLNRLLTLIRVCNEENAPKDKKSQKDVIAEHTVINAQRREEARLKAQMRN